MRRLVAALMLAGLTLGAVDSDAATIDVVSQSTSSGSSVDFLQVGDQVTLGIRIRDLDHASWLYFWIHGYDESVVDFESGESVYEIGSRPCEIVYVCFGGMRAWSTYLYESTEDGITKVLVFFESTMFLVSSNPLEPGLDGIIGGNDAQIRVTFVATGLGSTALQIDAGIMGPEGYLVGTGSPTPPVNARVTLNVIPEPSTSLLILLGLATLRWRYHLA